LLEVDGDGFGDAVEREVAGDFVAFVGFFDGRAGEFDGGELLDVEEVGERRWSSRFWMPVSTFWV